MQADSLPTELSGKHLIAVSLEAQLVKNLPAMWRLGFDSPGEGKGYPLQYSGLENSKDKGAWWATGHGVAKSCMTTRLSLSL